MLAIAIHRASNNIDMFNHCINKQEGGSQFFFVSNLFETDVLRSPVCYIFIVSFFVACIYLILKRDKKLKQELAKLSEEQKILIHDFETTIAALEQSREEIAGQNRFIKKLAIILSHDLQSPFRFMKTSMETLHQSILQQDDASMIAVSNALKNSCDHSFRFLTDFTLWLRSIHKDYKPKIEELNLCDMCNDLNIFFSELLKSRKNVLEQNIQHDLKVLTDKALLKVIFRNIIDNANKHNFEKTISIGSDVTAQQCNIIISDNGTGMPASTLEQIHLLINNRQDISFANDEDDSKQGHKLIAHFSKLLNLRISVHSKSSTGTTFSVGNLVRI